MVVIQQWEGPRPLGRVQRLGEGELASAPGERQDQQRRRRSRGPQKQDVVSSFRNRLLCAPRLWGGGGADAGRWAPLALFSSRRATALGGRAAPRPEILQAPWGLLGGWARGRPLVLLRPGLARGALTRNGYLRPTLTF